MSGYELSQSELDALQRYIRREKLGPGARKSLRRAQKKIRQHDEYIRSGNRDEDLEMHAQFLFDEYIAAGGSTEGVVPPARYGSGSTPAARRAAGSGPGSSPPPAGGPREREHATPRSPALGAGSSEGGGGAFDATTASPEQVQRWLALHPGVSLPPGTLDEFTNRRRGSTTNEIALQLAEAQARKHDRQTRAENERRAKEIDKARTSGEGFDAMGEDVSVDEVRAQLEELGIVDPIITDDLRPPGRDLERPKPKPLSKEQQVAARRDARLLREAEAGKRSVMGLSEAAFKAYLKAKGLEDPGSSWPAQRGPSRR